VISSAVKTSTLLSSNPKENPISGKDLSFARLKAFTLLSEYFQKITSPDLKSLLFMHFCEKIDPLCIKLFSGTPERRKQIEEMIRDPEYIKENKIIIGRDAGKFPVPSFDLQNAFHNFWKTVCTSPIMKAKFLETQNLLDWPEKTNFNFTWLDPLKVNGTTPYQAANKLEEFFAPVAEKKAAAICFARFCLREGCVDNTKRFKMTQHEAAAYFNTAIANTGFRKNFSMMTSSYIPEEILVNKTNFQNHNLVAFVRGAHDLWRKVSENKELASQLLSAYSC
jgi:hypothetical protein